MDSVEGGSTTGGAATLLAASSTTAAPLLFGVDSKSFLLGVSFLIGAVVAVVRAVEECVVVFLFLLLWVAASPSNVKRGRSLKAHFDAGGAGAAAAAAVVAGLVDEASGVCFSKEGETDPL